MIDSTIVITISIVFEPLICRLNKNKGVMQMESKSFISLYLTCLIAVLQRSSLHVLIDIIAMKIMNKTKKIAKRMI